jgi:thiosulfate/3-mercaptopyruvate sulfurtransferase
LLTAGSAAVPPPAAAQTTSPPWLGARPPEPVLDPVEVVVGPEWLAARAGDPGVVAVDTRPAADYAAGRLPGAAHLAPDAGCLAEGPPCVARALGALGLGGGQTLVLYSGGDDLDLARLFWLLAAAGAVRTKVLDGGVAAWTAAGGALETGPPATRAATAVPAPNGGAVATPEWLFDRLGDPGVVTLDLRDRGIWTENGYREPPRYAAGHLPGALPFDFGRWQPAGGRWPDLDGLRASLAGLGTRPFAQTDLGAEFVLYGEGPDDPRPGLGYLLLRRLGARARVLAGGFAGWAAGGGPVVRVVGAAEVRALLETENPGLAEDRPPESLVLIDLREDWDFARGHLPGAANVPFFDLAERFEPALAAHWGEVRRSEVPLVFYCYGRDCIRSPEACPAAAQAGFRKLLWFRDAIDGWSAAGYPLVR